MWLPDLAISWIRYNDHDRTSGSPDERHMGRRASKCLLCIVFIRKSSDPSHRWRNILKTNLWMLASLEVRTLHKYLNNTGTAQISGNATLKVTNSWRRPTAQYTSSWLSEMERKTLKYTGPFTSLKCHDLSTRCVLQYKQVVLYGSR